MINRINKLADCAILVLFAVVSVNGSILDFMGETEAINRQKVEQWDLSMRVAMWQSYLEDGAVQCELCPFRCILTEGDRGICGVRALIDDTLRALTYSRASAVNVDPIEKKPLFHFYPGEKALSIATVGCNLSCKFCQNWTLSQVKPEDIRHEYLPPEKVVELALQNDCKTIAYTYSEPTIFYEYMYETAELAHKNGLKNLMITCAYINPEPLRELAQYLDAANVDLKGWSDQFYSEYLKASKEPVLEALKILKEEGVWIEITNLVIPQANDDTDEIRKLVEWIARNIGEETPVHFSRFHPNYKLMDRPSTPNTSLEQARQIALDTGLKYVYVGNIPGSEFEDTYCPVCGRKIVDRTGFWINEYHIQNGKCGFCGEEIDGVYP